MSSFFWRVLYISDRVSDSDAVPKPSRRSDRIDKSRKEANLLPVVLGVGYVLAAAPAAQWVQAYGGVAVDRLSVAQLRLSLTVHLPQLDVRHFLQQPTCAILNFLHIFKMP